MGLAARPLSRRTRPTTQRPGAKPSNVTNKLIKTRHKKLDQKTTVEKE
jgi:hypothetical protein